MTEIFIDPTKPDISIQVLSESLHAVGFSITIFAADGATVLEQFTNSTQKANPFILKLANAPSTYKNGYISGSFTLLSPDGTDYSYNVTFSVMQQSAVVVPNSSQSGTTSGGKASFIINFHLN